MQKTIKITGWIAFEVLWITFKACFKAILFITFLTFSLVCSAVFAEGRVHSFETDTRAKMVSFNPNQIYPIKAHYLVSTDIILGNDEIINADDIHLGDASSWDVQASRNHIYIKAKKVDAAGNLSVTTNKYAYHFVLSVSEAPLDSSDQTLFIKFLYPTHGSDERKLALQMASVPNDICRDETKYNLQYSYTGDCEQAPIRACDDGIFTYLKFRKQVELPAIFLVLPDRKEAVVNYRVEDGYVVVERLGKAFTLRNGDVVTSVYNDKYIGDWHKVK
jgi:type IV secretion system protein VirB9